MSARAELAKYVLLHAAQVPDILDVPILIDVHFFKVMCAEDFDKAHFRDLFDAFVAEGKGEFDTEVTLERIEAGPSYIEWGGWIGDQSLALKLMAAGEYAGMWTVITPKVLGIDGPAADDLAGRGLVMTSGLKPRVAS